MLTPLDIHNQEFRRVLRGYSPDEVDDFLDRVVGDFEALLKQTAELRAEAEALRTRVEQYKQLENTLHGALIVAQETAEDVKQSARKEAQLIVREAEEEAGRRMGAAEVRTRELEERLAQVQREAAGFRAQMRGQLEMQLELLREPLPALRRAESGAPAARAGDTQVAPAAVPAQP